MAVREGQVLARLDDCDAARRAGAGRGAARRRRGGRCPRPRCGSREAQRHARAPEQLLGGGRRRHRPTLDRREAEVDSLARAPRPAREQVSVAERQVARAADRARRHGHPRAVRRRRDLEGRPAGRDDLAGLGRRRLHPHRHLHHRRHGVARDRGRRQRELHQPRRRRASAVEAVLDAYPDWRIPAQVITTIPTADRQKATVLVRIGFDELDPRILPDMGVKVAFLREAGRRQAPAARGRGAGARARRCGSDGGQRRRVRRAASGTVERRAVRLGGTDGDRVEVAGRADGRRAGRGRRRRPTLADGDAGRRQVAAVDERRHERDRLGPGQRRPQGLHAAAASASTCCRASTSRSRRATSSR